MEIIIGPFGIQSPWPHPRALPDVYEDQIAYAQLAEELGVDGIALTEHSFWYDGYLPSLLPVIAAIAERTSRIKLMIGALLLPQHDPLKVAEECAVVDRLTGGRLIFCFGAGYRTEEFVGHGVPEGRWGARLFEGIEVVRRALTEETFSFEGEFYRYENVSLGTRPVQEDPVIWVGGGIRPWAPRGAGRRGWPLLVAGGGLQNSEPGVFAEYEQAAERAGHDPSTLRRGIFRDVMVMPSERDAQAILEEDYWDIMRDQLLGFGFLEVLMGQKVYEVPPEMRPMLLQNPGVWAGTAAQVREQARAVLGLNLDLLLVRTMWANYKMDRANQNLETFAREVMPMLKAEEALR